MLFTHVYFKKYRQLKADDKIPIQYDTHLTKKSAIPPVLILHGTKDRLVSYNQSELLYEKLRETNKNVTMYRLKGADHGDPAF
jgi:dipeptidyl aminopeptidase/acylaminoacyl peptidase